MSAVYLSQGTQLFLFLLIVLSNVVFLVYWAVKMLQELKSMFVKKFGKIYTCLCLCGRTEKYKDVLEITQIQEENEILREKFLEVLRRIKEMQTAGTLVLSKKVLEKFGFYL